MSKTFEELIDEVAAKKVGFESLHWFGFDYYVADQGGMFVVGAVCPLIIRGKNKGKPNYRKRDRNTQRKVYLSKEELSRIEANTGEKGSHDK